MNHAAIFWRPIDRYFQPIEALETLAPFKASTNQLKAIG